jgi:hypothetical protein
MRHTWRKASGISNNDDDTSKKQSKDKACAHRLVVTL